MLAPTHAASNQCVLGRPRVERLNLVRPPDPHSTGRPVAWSRRYNSQRVVLTTVASLSGALACFRTLARTSGSLFRNTSIGLFPLRRLHGSHASVRFETRSEPPRLLGWMCSTWSGTSVVPQ